jgi:two-component system sensor histidine kinase KdpD
MPSRRDLVPWLVWGTLMVVVTVVLVQLRDTIDQVHVILVYLLVVLGASRSGGRLLAFPLAIVGFLLIDYYFQFPYNDFTHDKPLDLVALVSFLMTAFVATDLLVRANTQATEADARAVEIASLARLGSETLSAGRAEDALARIADVIKSTLKVAECSITAWDPEAGFTSPTRGAVAVPVADEPLFRRAIESPAPIWVRASGEVVRSPGSDQRGPEAADLVQRILMPLSVQARPVGLLEVTNDAPVALDRSQRRFLDAITYYAALAADRVRLVAEAEHAEALREADRLKDIVLASVSHDLRTPLTTIKALAQSEALQGNSSAAAIEEQADRLTRLVSDLLDLSRLKGGGFAANPELNTAEDLIGAAVRQTRGLFGERQLRTIIDLDSPALVGHFDFAQSLRIVCNLLENAARYSPPTQPIELAAQREGAQLVFTVSDRGPGVRDEDLARIFEPFFRAADAVPDTGRAGLGLSIARTLAELQGGSVTYTPRAGGGSVFALHLPATELRFDALEQTGVIPSDTSAAASTTSSRTSTPRSAGA